MRFIAASALAVYASALSCADFPSDSFNHAGCHMTATFNQFNCADAENILSSVIKSWANGDSCAASGFPGFYTLKLETQGQCVWSTRLTANKQYTDDQLFQFTAAGAGCKITAKSRSESMSYLDSCVNYCNMHNVFTAMGAFTLNDVSHCSQTPSDVATTCARY